MERIYVYLSNYLSDHYNDLIMITNIALVILLVSVVLIPILVPMIRNIKNHFTAFEIIKAKAVIKGFLKVPIPIQNFQTTDLISLGSTVTILPLINDKGEFIGHCKDYVELLSDDGQNISVLVEDNAMINFLRKEFDLGCPDIFIEYKKIIWSGKLIAMKVY